MAIEAARALGVGLEGAFVVGDKDCDIQLGKAIAATSVLVRTGHGGAYAQGRGPRPDAVFANLEEAANWILTSTVSPSDQPSGQRHHVQSTTQ